MTQSFLGYPEDAIALYQQALQIFPTSPTINSLLAEAYETTENLQQAVYYAEQARSFDPDQTTYHQHLVELYTKLGDSNRAEATLLAMQSAFPNSNWPLEELARIQFDSNRLDEALATYRLLEQRTGPQPLISQRILQIYSQKNDFEGVESTLLELDRMSPDNPAVKRLLSEVYANTGRLPEAIRILEDALDTNSSDLETVAALAQLYQKSGDETKAQALWQNILVMDGSPEQMVEQASRLFEQSENLIDQRQAITALLNRALDANPDLEAALLLLGQIRFEDEEYESAGELLFKAVSINARNQNAWLQSATAFLRAGQPKRAAEIADEALLLFPGQLNLIRVAAYGSMDAYENAQAIRYFDDYYQLIENEPSYTREAGEILAALGLLYTRIADHEAADSTYTLALEHAPDHAVVLNNYAYSLAERNESLEKALDLAERAVKLDPSNPSYLDTLGWVHFKMNRLQDAELWIQKAVGSGEATAATYEHLGDIQARLGKSEAARTSWNKSLEMNPANQRLKQKLEANDE